MGASKENVNSVRTMKNLSEIHIIQESKYKFTTENTKNYEYSKYVHSIKKGSPVHIAPACIRPGEGSNHFGSMNMCTQ
jgi:hypothetical protein